MDGEILVLLQNIYIYHKSQQRSSIWTLMYILASLLIYNSFTKTAKKFLFQRFYKSSSDCVN